MEVHAMSIMEHVSKKNVIITDDFFEYYTKLVKDTIIPYQWDALNDRIPNAEPSTPFQNCLF
jgi:DUF1680 family protein